MNEHLVMYLIWWRDSTAKDAIKTNTPPNVIRLMYVLWLKVFMAEGFFRRKLIVNFSLLMCKQYC